MSLSVHRFIIIFFIPFYAVSSSFGAKAKIHSQVCFQCLLGEGIVSQKHYLSFLFLVIGGSNIKCAKLKYLF